MRLFPEGRSKNLSAASLAAALGAGLMTLKSTVDLLTMLLVFSTPSFFLSMVNATLPVEMPPLAALLADHIRSSFLFFFLFWLSAFALSVGVWRRREWARRGAVGMLYLLSAAALLVLLFPWLVVPRPLVYGELQLAPDFNSVVRLASFLARLVSAAGGSLSLWWALALDRGPLRLEFTPGERKK